MSELSQAEGTAMESAIIARRPEEYQKLERVWRAGRDYGKERERALREALDGLFDAARPYLDHAAPHEQLFNGEDLRNFEALSKAIVQADAALAASQPEVLSERSDTEHGEPEDVPGRCVIEDDGREGNMVVAAYTRQQAIIDALKILQNRTVGSPEACARAIDVLTAGLAAEENAQPAHGPGKPSEDSDQRRILDLLERWYPPLPASLTPSDLRERDIATETLLREHGRLVGGAMGEPTGWKLIHEAHLDRQQVVVCATAATIMYPLGNSEPQNAGDFVGYPVELAGKGVVLRPVSGAWETTIRWLDVVGAWLRPDAPNPCVCGKSYPEEASHV